MTIQVILLEELFMAVRAAVRIVLVVMYLQMLLHVVHLAEVLLAGDTLQDLVVPMGLLIQCF